METKNPSNQTERESVLSQKPQVFPPVSPIPQTATTKIHSRLYSFFQGLIKTFL